MKEYKGKKIPKSTTVSSNSQDEYCDGVSYIEDCPAQLYDTDCSVCIFYDFWLKEFKEAKEKGIIK